jgi:hypothetical protein
VHVGGYAGLQLHRVVQITFNALFSHAEHKRAELGIAVVVFVEMWIWS